MPQLPDSFKDFPHVIQLAVAEMVEALRREEIDLRQHLLDYHDPLFVAFQDELRRWFLAHYRVQPDPVHPDRQQQVWDALAAQRDETLQAMEQAITDLFDAAAEEDADLFAEELDAALMDGALRELWLLTLQDEAEELEEDEAWADAVLEELPDVEGRRSLLLLAGVAGVSWLDRLTRWHHESRQQLHQWVRASVLSGQTLQETVAGVAHIRSGFDGHVQGLLANEVHLAFGLGSAMAASAAQRSGRPLELLWVARTDGRGEPDALVCPVCRELHMTVVSVNGVVTMRPVEDSHPACRCVLVPYVLDARGGVRRQPFVDFVAGLGDDA